MNICISLYVYYRLCTSLNTIHINILNGQFYRVQVGVQSPEGITTVRGVLRRFNDFLKLFSHVSTKFPLQFVVLVIPPC